MQRCQLNPLQQIVSITRINGPQIDMARDFRQQNPVRIWTTPTQLFRNSMLPGMPAPGQYHNGALRLLSQMVLNNLCHVHIPDQLSFAEILKIADLAGMLTEGAADKCPIFRADIAGRKGEFLALPV
jgi:hypothetical protein